MGGLRFWTVATGLALAVAAPAAHKIDRSRDDALTDPRRPAVLAQWVHPDYPPALKATRARGEYRVRFVVNEHAEVTAIEGAGGDERFKDAALAAIARWKYELPRGLTTCTPICLEVVFTFDPLGPPQTESTFTPPYEVTVPELQPPEEERSPDPAYPDYLVHRELFGDVEFLLAVDKEGRIAGLEVKRACYPDFITAALETLKSWRFRPAHRGPLPVDAKKGAVLSFVVRNADTDEDRKRDWPELNGLALHVPGDPKATDYFTAPMTPVVFVDPVYPEDLRARGVAGKARASFTVDETGRTTNVTVLEAADPALGAALAAAVQAWVFEPLYHAGEKVAADFFVTWQFGPPPDGSPAALLLGRLAQGVKPVGARDLDRVPAVLFRRHPAYPPELKAAKVAGDATVEVVIDRNGQACLPRIVSASDPAFGWAAATAVSQWYFESPESHGQPVDVRVAIPLHFRPE